MVIGGMAAAFFLDKPQGTWTNSTWLALLLNRQQHFDLYAHSARRAPLGQRVLQGQPREAATDRAEHSSMLSACYPLDLFFRGRRPLTRLPPHCFSLPEKYSFDGGKTAPGGGNSRIVYRVGA